MILATTMLLFMNVKAQQLDNWWGSWPDTWATTSDVEIDGLRYAINIENREAVLIDVNSSVTDLVVPSSITISDRIFTVRSVMLRFGEKEHDYSFIRSISLPNSNQLKEVSLGRYRPSYNDIEVDQNTWPNITSLDIPPCIEDFQISFVRGLKTLSIPSTLKRVGAIRGLPNLDSLFIEKSNDSLLWYSKIWSSDFYGHYYPFDGQLTSNPNYHLKFFYYGRVLVNDDGSRVLYPFAHPYWPNSSGWFCYSALYGERLLVVDSLIISPNIHEISGIWCKKVIVPNTINEGLPGGYGIINMLSPLPYEELFTEEIIFEDGTNKWGNLDNGYSSLDDYEDYILEPLWLYNSGECFAPSYSNEIYFARCIVPKIYIGRPGVVMPIKHCRELTIGPLLTSEQAADFFNSFTRRSKSNSVKTPEVSGNNAFIKLFQVEPPVIDPDTYYYPGLYDTYFTTETYLNTTLFVPRGTKQLYEQAYEWRNFFHIEEFDWDAPEHIITVTSNNTSMGSVSGGGVYNYGGLATLTAVPNDGYYFKKWTENGEEVCNSSTFSFVVDGDRTLTAVFDVLAPNEFTVSATCNPLGAGTIQGIGVYQSGATATLTAIPNNGYSFLNWTENGAVVCNTPTYTFIVNGEKNLVAYFGGLGIEENETESKISIFANANRTITIIGAEKESQVIIYNIRGQMIYKGTEKTIKMTNSGLYIVAVENKRMKVVVE